MKVFKTGCKVGWQEYIGGGGIGISDDTDSINDRICQV